MSTVVDRSQWFDVWAAPFHIPPELLEAVAKEMIEYPIRDDTGVDLLNLYWTDQVRQRTVRALMCDGYCGWHNDAHVNQYSALLVLRNDTNAWVEVEDCVVKRRQPVGSLIWLDVWQNHRLIQRGANDGPVGVYLVSCLETDVPWSRERVETEYRRVLGIKQLLDRRYATSIDGILRLVCNEDRMDTYYIDWSQAP